jgi:hypothetical protein
MEWKARLSRTCERLEAHFLADIKSEQAALKAKNSKLSEPKLNGGSMSNQIELLQKAIAEEKMEGKK